jgi:hypothetical protein
VPDDNPSPTATSQRAHKGSRSHKAVLTEADIPTIRAQRAAGISHRRIAKTYGVSHQAIEKITSGVNWRHVP